MSGMHMLPVYYTTTNHKRRKKKTVTQAMKKAQAEHAKFLKKVGYVPKADRAKIESTSKSHIVKPISKTAPTSDYIGNGFKNEAKIYHGSAVIGQAYNKGNLVVLSVTEQKDENTGKRR